MEKMEMNCDKGSALVVFLTGLGAGIALTLLLAPRSGAATRRLIGRKVDEGEDWIRDKAEAAQDCVKERVKELRDRVGEMAR
jgi:gas vesicle protein